jgi:hypothetical protein
MLTAAGLRTKDEGENMSVRILTALCVLCLSAWVTAAAAAHPSASHKPQFTASQQLCLGDNGTFSTKAGSSFFRPFFKKQGVLWTCNGYTGGSTSSQALVQSCSSDGGQAASTIDSGFATCWQNAPL